MGRFRFLRECINKVSDVLNGRFSSFEEILRDFLKTSSFDVESFVGSNFYDEWNGKNFKKRVEFILAQMLMICEAKSILRFRSGVELWPEKRDQYGRVVKPYALERYQKCAFNVFQAMRHEIDKRLENSSYVPIFLYVFRNVLDEMTKVGGEDRELKYLGFKMLDEYFSVRQKVLVGELNHDQIKSFYGDYNSKIHWMMFECFEREMRPPYDPEDNSRDAVYSKWCILMHTINVYYEYAMCRVRITEISKDFL